MAPFDSALSWGVIGVRVAERAQGNLGAVALDHDFRIVTVSDGVLHHSGIPRSQLIGVKTIELVHPDDVSRAQDVLEEVQAIAGDRPDICRLGVRVLVFSVDSWRAGSRSAHRSGVGDSVDGGPAFADEIDELASFLG